MSPLSRRLRFVIGGGIGILAAALVLASTGPSPEIEMNSTIRRLGGPCLQLEQWGLFGWVVIGRTSTMTQATNGAWNASAESDNCEDVEDSLILVRLPSDAAPDSYRICGWADEQACITVRRVEFRGSSADP